MYKTYEDAFRRSIENKDEFWAEAAQDIQWIRPWDKVLDDSRLPFYRWFPGAKMNTCYNTLDYHVENGAGDKVAVIYDSPVTNTIQKITYRELLKDVAEFAGVLTSLGV